MIPFEVGDHVRINTRAPQKTPNGMELLLRWPEGVDVGAHGIVAVVTKTGPGLSAPTAFSAKTGSLPPPKFFPPHLWYVQVELDGGRKVTFLAGHLRKLNLLEILAEVSRSRRFSSVWKEKAVPAESHCPDCGAGFVQGYCPVCDWHSESEGHRLEDNGPASGITRSDQAPSS